MRVADVRLLKKLLAVLGLLAAGFIGGSLLGFALGYVIAGEGRSNIHGDAILVGLLTIGGAIAGLIVGGVTACRVGRRMIGLCIPEGCCSEMMYPQRRECAVMRLVAIHGRLAEKAELQRDRM